MRDYLQGIGVVKPIIIVASPKVQHNFRLQLFDEQKLQKVNGIWNIQSCIGNKLLREINPLNAPGYPRDRIISQINALISTAYRFYGYVQFANIIAKSDDYAEYRKKKLPRNGMRAVGPRNNLNTEFSDSLIVIDEIHNINEDDVKTKVVAENLVKLVKGANNLRLLLLSATPMYNSYKEIIWLLNLMNMNDRRGTISVSDVFDKDGDFKEDGRDVLARKATGYISYVRGENPYTFPFRVYPEIFARDKTLLEVAYPKTQLNGKHIDEDDAMKVLSGSVYLGHPSAYQLAVYKSFISKLKADLSKRLKTTTKLESLTAFNYTYLTAPLQSLCIVYPKSDNMFAGAKSEEDDGQEEEDELEDEGELEKDDNESSEEDLGSISRLTGGNGLKTAMNFVDTEVPPVKGSFSYKDWVTKQHGRIFSYKKIGKYSWKIKKILKSIVNGEGVTLVYSQYIDGGLVPLALALEELGLSKYNSTSLFGVAPSPPLNSKTMKPIKAGETTVAKYVMITGDHRLSPQNDEDIRAVTNKNNKNGDIIKVILISMAGAEGIDFKFVRQIHIIDPWYNLNRIEQIIGRGVRNFSHKDLPFEKRNVEIYMYASLLGDETEESVDMYIYRQAEYKAVKMGKVSRLLKETAVDCILNHEQTNFTQELMEEHRDAEITQVLSSGKVILDFKVGDVPFSPTCDYMESCTYKCTPHKARDELQVKDDSYGSSFMMMNYDTIRQKIHVLFKERFFYKKEQLITAINIPRKYPLSQIYAALTQMVEDESEVVSDKYGRPGSIVNIGEYYLYQPSELTNENATIFDRVVPVDFKHETIQVYADRIQPSLDEGTSNARKLVVELETSYDEAVTAYESHAKIGKRVESFYPYCGKAMQILANDFGAAEDDLYQFLLDHLVDTLKYAEKLILLKYVFAATIQEDSFEYKIRDFFESLIVRKDETYGMPLCDENGKTFVLELDGHIWKNAEPRAEEDIMEAYEIKYRSKLLQIANLIGVIGSENKARYMVFKTVTRTAKRNTGARCDQAGKAQKILVLNAILGNDRYNKENTKALHADELCALQEFLLRLYDKNKEDGKSWFFQYEQTILFNVIKTV